MRVACWWCLLVNISISRFACFLFVFPYSRLFLFARHGLRLTHIPSFQVALSLI